MDTDNQNPQIIRSISSLALSQPALTALLNADIKTIDELCGTTSHELITRWRFGHAAMVQIQARLHELGLTLKGEELLPQRQKLNGESQENRRSELGR